MVSVEIDLIYFNGSSFQKNVDDLSSIVSPPLNDCSEVFTRRRLEELGQCGIALSVAHMLTAALLAAAFSIVATAASGKVVNYASAQNSISAMLNTYLHNDEFARYTNLLRHLISNTASGEWIKDSVWELIERHMADDQAGVDSREWQLLRMLLPEAIDPVLREELLYLDALPDWARS